MNIIDRPVEELGIDPQNVGALHARWVILNTVLDSLDETKVEASIFSGFDGSCIVDGEYRPPSNEPIGQGVLYAVSAVHWRQAYRGIRPLRDPGSFALLKQVETPALGVYDAEQFVRGRGVRWQLKDGLSVPDTCTDIFTWR